jgi:hypothetical protein
MVSSGLLRRVALVRTDVSEELNASFIRVTRIGELGGTLAVTSNRRTLRRNTSSPIFVTLMKEALSSSETSVSFCCNYTSRAKAALKPGPGVVGDKCRPVFAFNLRVQGGSIVCIVMTT